MSYIHRHDNYWLIHHWSCRCFLHQQEQGGQDCVFQFWDSLVNYKAHYDLSRFRPLLRGNSHTSIGLISKINKCYNGVSKELRKFVWWRGKWYHRALYLKGRGPFIDHWRSVGASMVFPQVPECSWSWGGRCSRRFLELVRHWLYLTAKPSHVEVDVDKLSYSLHRPTACSHQTRGHGFLSVACLVLSPQWVVVPF
jgi:hypothetical protein